MLDIEHGLSAREATYNAMREVWGPIVAIALTLSAVFVPLAFMSGMTGQFFKQLALTIAISTLISAFNSLTLSPALGALLLKGHDAKDRFQLLIDKLLGWFSVCFNRMFRRGSHAAAWLRYSSARALRSWCTRCCLGRTACCFTVCRLVSCRPRISNI